IHAQLWENGNPTDAGDEGDRIFAGRWIGQTVLGIRAGAAHSPSRFIEQSGRQRGYESNRQDLRLSMGNAVEAERPHTGRIIGMNALQAPGPAEFVLRADVVIDLGIELLPRIGNTEAKTVLTADTSFEPA